MKSRDVCAVSYHRQELVSNPPLASNQTGLFPFAFGSALSRQEGYHEYHLPASSASCRRAFEACIEHEGTAKQTRELGLRLNRCQIDRDVFVSRSRKPPRVRTNRVVGDTSYYSQF